MTKIKVLDLFIGGSMAHTYLIKKGDKTLVRKSVAVGTELGTEKLMKQHEWLKRFADNENIVNVDKMFNVGSCVITGDEVAWYDMEFVEGNELVDIILNEEYNSKYIEEFLRIGGEIAQPVSYTNPTPQSDYVVEKHLSKIIERNSKDNNYLYTVFNSYLPIIINGKRYEKHGYPLITELMNDEDFINFMGPNRFYTSHGDYTLQNVIYNEGNLTVIDPRGEGPDTIFYDISKIYQSLHGKYDLISKGEWNVDYGSDFMGHFIDYSLDEEKSEKLDKYFEVAKLNIPKYYNLKTEYNEVNEHLSENWDIIARFYEASHFLSMTPFRLEESIKSAIICYAIGTEILNKVVEDYKNVQKKSKLVANS